MSTSQLEGQLTLFNSFERLTVDDAFSIFHEIEGKNKGPNYKYQYKPIKDFFRQHYGAKPSYLDLHNPMDIQQMRKWLEAEGMMPSTANRVQSCYTRMMNFFYEGRSFPSVGPYVLTNLKLPLTNPGEQVKKVDERPFTRKLVLTPMEFFKFCDYAHPRIRVITIIALLTLLRRKNIRILGEENFNKALQQIQTVQSKTGVPITIPAQQTVQVIIEGMSYQCQIDFTNYRRLMVRARKESGVFFWLTDLRRTGATQMLMDGVDIRTIQRYLGHTTLVMTERYLQPPVQHMKQAGEIVEKRFASSVALIGIEKEMGHEAVN